MKLRKWMDRALCGMMVLLWGMLPAFAAAARIEERSLELGESRIAYPCVAGLEDAELEKKVNEQIQADGEIVRYLTRMSELISGGSLRVSWTGGLYGEDGIFSCGILAEGAVETARETSRWTCCNLDLADGRVIELADLFRDGPESLGRLGELLEREIAPEMSPMLLNCQLAPAPETFRLDETGVTLLYPWDRLCTLGDRAGDVHLAWCELGDMLNGAPDGIPARLGAARALTLDEAGAGLIRETAALGRLPGIPASIGQAMKELTDQYHLLTDPDVYEGGRMFALEGGCFRKVYLLTDDLTEDWDQSRVQGIRMDRGNVYGLCVGTTEREAWLAALGEPDDTVSIDAEKAELNRTVPGSCDYYTCGAYQLRLTADERQVLSGIILTE